MMIWKKAGLVIFLGVFTFFTVASQEEGQKMVACVGFYNLENLFDTFDDPNVIDEEFLPEGKKKWDFEKYSLRLKNTATVIEKLGGKNYPYGPAILGVCEVENKKVLQDLVAMPQIANRKYGIVHYNSPDKRGIDVALLYQPRFFEVEESKSYRLTIPGKNDFFSRDQLLVTGKLNGERMHIIVNHWPSRWGGEKESRPLRIEAAKLCKSIVDSIQKSEKEAKIIVMGDFNDDPSDLSMKKIMKGKSNIAAVSSSSMYNPMRKLHDADVKGTLMYRGKWNLFDQILLSKSLVKPKTTSYSFFAAQVFDQEFLKVSEGDYKGYPFRTYVGDNFHGGYSDHFPVYVYLIKEHN